MQGVVQEEIVLTCRNKTNKAVKIRFVCPSIDSLLVVRDKSPLLMCNRKMFAQERTLFPGPFLAAVVPV